jgi:hypothetical protein
VKIDDLRRKVEVKWDTTEKCCGFMGVHVSNNKFYQSYTIRMEEALEIASFINQQLKDTDGAFLLDFNTEAKNEC